MNTLIVSRIIKKPVYHLKKEDLFHKLKNKCPNDDKVRRTKKLLKYLILKTEKN